MTSLQILSGRTILQRSSNRVLRLLPSRFGRSTGVSLVIGQGQDGRYMGETPLLRLSS
jgi:hypothetical protein